GPPPRKRDRHRIIPRICRERAPETRRRLATHSRDKRAHAPGHRYYYGPIPAATWRLQRHERNHVSFDGSPSNRNWREFSRGCPAAAAAGAGPAESLFRFSTRGRASLGDTGYLEYRWRRGY